MHSSIINEVRMFFTVCSVPQFLLLLFFSLLDFLPVENFNYNGDSMAPIVLIPGLGGTQIEGRWKTHGEPSKCWSKSLRWERLWLKLDIAQPQILKCWAFRFLLKYDKATHKCRNQDGVTTRIPFRFGSCKPVEFLTQVTKMSKTDYYHVMIEAFEKSGYSTDLGLKAAGYDWRYAVPQLKEWGYFNQLAQLIEQVANDSKRKVALIAHSMGGLVAAHFLLSQSQSWKDKHIQSLTTIATPWLGSPQSFINYLIGTTFGLPNVKESTMKDVARTFESVAYLLPAEEAYKDTVLIDWVSKNKKYTAKDYEQLFKDIGYEDAYLMRQNLRSQFPVPLDKLGVPMNCIWSTVNERQTLEMYRIEGDLQDTKSIKAVYTDGDGTVPLKSLRFCETFKGVTVKTFQGPDHTGILEKGEVIDYVKSLLTRAKPFT